jgi:hypothetical protein
MLTRPDRYNGKKVDNSPCFHVIYNLVGEKDIRTSN